MTIVINIISITMALSLGFGPGIALGETVSDDLTGQESALAERPGEVTMRGKAVTLLGTLLQPGDKAPDFVLLRNDMTDARLLDFSGKVILISVVPSLDTGVCDLQTKRFNREAGSLEDAAVLTVSMDLPFAQKRWCGVNDATNLVTLSDHRTAEFGKSYGVLIKDMRLLARSVFVIGKDGLVKYVQVVPEMATEPDYAAAIDAARRESPPK